MLTDSSITEEDQEKLSASISRDQLVNIKQSMTQLF